VIALFYSSGIALSGLLLVALGVLLTLLMQWLSLRSPLAYIVPGALVWYGMLTAGMHPTLAGVILGLLTPASARFGRRKGAVARGTPSPVQQLEQALHAYVAFGIMPLFALANAGVVLAGLDLRNSAPLAVGTGIMAGLVLGKLAGIFLAAFLAVHFKLCTLPKDITWRHIVLLGLLGGIGFTMSIFIANLAFEDATLLAAAKFAVLVASCLAAVLGFAAGWLQPRERAARAGVSGG
jgi:Na+:H+ antiporter, NhaA family